jgi:hypothetical protein
MRMPLVNSVVRTLAFLSSLAILAVARADSWEELHSCVCRVGDCDGDGVPDLAVAARDPKANGVHFVIPGRVWLISGKTGKLIWVVDGATKGDGFGCSLAAAGDVDGDGVPDVIVGAVAKTDDESSMINPVTVGLSYARVLSGKDGHVVHEFRSALRTTYLGYAVGGGADLDGDGTPDLLVGAPSNVPRSNCTVYSGKTGKDLLTIACTNEHELRFAYAVAFVGDLDGDGRPEIAIGCPQTVNDGSVLICSGKDGSTLRTLRCEVHNNDFGWSLSAWGDSKDKKRSALAVGACGCLVRTYALDDFRVLGTTIGRGRCGELALDGFGASLDFAIVNPGADPRLLVGAQDMDPDKDGYAEVVRLDGSREFVAQEAKKQGIDTCFAGDCDGDGVIDIAVVLVKDEILRIQSGKHDKTLVEVKLLELRPGASIAPK